MNFSKLDAFMNSIPLCGIPSCELSVTHNGEQIYRAGVGFSDAKKTRPVSCRDIYWIFSATKVITCIAAMRLVEEGKIGLDDPVSKYIPEYANLTIKQKDGTLTPAKTAMTVRHLFTMTGGMTYNCKSESILAATTPTASTLDLVRAMAKDPIRFEPGTHYMYSLCHDVLGAVIEVASGMRLSDYFDTFIFKPLGITDMGFRPNDEQKSRFVAMYTYQNGVGTSAKRECKNSYALSPDYDSGGAGLFATVDDYMKIITTVACGGTTRDGYRLLKPETIAMLQKNELCDDALNDFVSHRHFGYGWGLCGRAHIAPMRSQSLSPVGEFGWDGAAAAFVMVDPIQHVAIYLGTHIHNCAYMYHVCHPTIRNLVYEALGQS